MAKPFTPYLDYDAQGISRVGCMRCNKTVADRQEGRLVHMTHSKRLRVELEDKSYADLILCAGCLNSFSSDDIPELEKSMKWGHREEISRRLGGAVPLELGKKLIAGKGIVRRK